MLVSKKFINADLSIKGVQNDEFSFNTNDSQLSVERITLSGTPAIKRTRKPAVHSMSELFSRSMQLEGFE